VTFSRIGSRFPDHTRQCNTWRLQGPRGSQGVPIDSRFAVNDMRVLAQACVAGLGIAQLIVEPLIAQGKLVRVLPTYRRASMGLGLQLVYTSRPPLPAAVAVFAEFLLEKLGDAMPSADGGRQSSRAGYQQNLSSRPPKPSRARSAA
jgi:DNA-binding transcriptional LysR family regulator